MARKLGAMLGVGAAVLLLGACHDGVGPVGPTRPAAAVSGAADGKYIVVFGDAVSDAPGLARRLAQAHGGTLRFTYQYALKGFAATLPGEAAAALARDPNVRYVEPDAPVQLFAVQSNPPSWGLDRIDQLDLPLNSAYAYNVDGTGSNVYIFDTGINRGHVDFGGRANFVPAGANGNTQGNFVPDGRADATDCHGHGTHVAGTAGGASYGVAKNAAIWSARVVDCNGSGDVSYAIAAVDWCTASCLRPAVVNMSLGYGNVQSLRDAVERSVAAGVNYAVAAGNGNFLGVPQDACAQSPAGAPNANTVGATDINDHEASFSNYGTCVDILAPGVNITSDWYTSSTATNTISGTSMATPHVTGAIALYLQSDPTATPAAVSAALVGNATPNTITLNSTTRGTPNRMLYTGFIGGGGTPTDFPPTASFSRSCSGFTCTFTSTSTDDHGIAGQSWTNDGAAAGTGTSFTATYARGNATHTVTLTVTDTAGQTAASTQTVTCNKKRCS